MTVIELRNALTDYMRRHPLNKNSQINIAIVSDSFGNVRIDGYACIECTAHSVNDVSGPLIVPGPRLTLHKTEPNHVSM